MKKIYKRYTGGGESAEDSDIEAFIADDGSLNILTASDHNGAFLAEKHILEFIDALRRAYADRYDIVKKTARRGATKESYHDQRDTDRDTESKD